MIVPSVTNTQWVEPLVAVTQDVDEKDTSQTVNFAHTNFTCYYSREMK